MVVSSDFFRNNQLRFGLTDEINSFSITTPGHWNSNSAENTSDKLHKLKELRSQNDIELHVEQYKKRNNFVEGLLFNQS